MKTNEREKMVKAMEFIMRQVNDESVLMTWLSCGVADGDIKYGDLDTTVHDENLDYYMEDDNFRLLMAVFLRRMARAYRSGGLYCDDICSGDRDDWEKEETKDISFISDKEKMNDFFLLSKDEFLASYSYLTEDEYWATVDKVKELIRKR